MYIFYISVCLYVYLFLNINSTLNGTYGNPLYCAIDIDGDVIFCEVTGKIYKFEFIE
tara:strand:+ start:14715 stop:14885 length:171 start_codon:yes stop_codon:yes gene_type:complete